MEQEAIERKRSFGIGWVWVLPVILILISVFSYARWLGKQEGFAVSREILSRESTLVSEKDGDESPVNTVESKSGKLNPIQRLVRPNPDGRYLILVYEEDGKCNLSVRDANDHLVSFEEFSGTEVIECRDEMFFEAVGFLGWGSGGKFAVMGGNGLVKVIDLDKKIVREVRVTDGSGQIIGADNDFENWLVKIIGESEVYYAVFRNGKQTDKIWKASRGGHEMVMKDLANDGFVMADRLYTDSDEMGRQDVYQKFYFWKLAPGDIRKLFDYKGTIEGGRGCNPAYLMSIKGEIVVRDLSCFHLSDEVMRDGEIRFKL